MSSTSEKTSCFNDEKDYDGGYDAPKYEEVEGDFEALMADMEGGPYPHELRSREKTEDVPKYEEIGGDLEALMADMTLGEMTKGRPQERFKKLTKTEIEESELSALTRGKTTHSSRESKIQRLREFLDVPLDENLPDMFEHPEYSAYIDAYKAATKEKQKDYPNPTVALTWQFLQMPDFKFLAVIRRNDIAQGLLATLVRHYNDWNYVIPGLTEKFKEFPPSFQSRLEEIQVLPNLGLRKKGLTKEFINWKNMLKLKRMDCTDELEKLERTYKQTLSQLQTRIYQFLKNNITAKNYRETNVDRFGRIQYLFNVGKMMEEEIIMFICVSWSTYAADRRYDDERPVCSIITIFFNTVENWLKKNASLEEIESLTPLRKSVK